MKLDITLDRSLLLTALLLLGACSDATAPLPGDPGIRVVSGDGQTDTIEAVLPEAIEVEIRDGSGTLAAGIPVTVTGCPMGCIGLIRRAGTSDPFAAQISLPTDYAGRVRIEVRLYGVARVGTITISAPSLGLTGSASATVLPGQAVGLHIAPHDTALHIGATYAAIGTTHDRYNNIRSDLVSLTISTPSTISLSGGGTVEGLAFGRGKITASAGSFTDTAYVSVVPAGTLAAGVFEVPSHVAILDLDGSGYSELVETGVYGGGAPSWSPDGATIAYQYYGSAGFGSLWITSPDGSPVKLIPDPPPSFEEEHFPRYSHDGEWIYFQGMTFTTQLGEIWRIHPNGSGLERIGPSGGASGGDFFPDPSPDGSKVVLATNRGDQYGPTRIVIRDVTTGTDFDLGVRGTYPRWSPVGEDIAFYSAGTDSTPPALTLIRSDGTDRRVLAVRTGPSSYQGIAWSPDGQWLVTDVGGGLALTQVASGAILPLRTGGQLHFDPSWKPQ